MATRELEAAEVVRRVTTETKQVAVKTIPKANSTAGREAGSEFQRQRPVAGASDVLAQLLFVGREDSDAAPPARDGYIPLLRVGRSLDRRVGEQNVIHRPSLRTVRRDGVAKQEFTETFVQYATVVQFDATVGTN